MRHSGHPAPTADVEQLEGILLAPHDRDPRRLTSIRGFGGCAQSPGEIKLKEPSRRDHSHRLTAVEEVRQLVHAVARVDPERRCAERGQRKLPHDYLGPVRKPNANDVATTDPPRAQLACELSDGATELCERELRDAFAVALDQRRMLRVGADDRRQEVDQRGDLGPRSDSHQSKRTTRRANSQLPSENSTWSS